MNRERATERLSPLDLVRQRLNNQQLHRAARHEPEEVVAWFGAVQAQDYGGAKWALGLRAKGIDESAVDRAFDEGRILRTHVLRPTWHFVAPADIRWILRLSAPRVHAANGFLYRQLELDARTLARGRAALERALEGGRQLTRPELAVALGRAGIAANGIRLAYLMMHAELEGVVCSGARRGRQFTYALFEERAACRTVLSADESLAALTRRYFTSHGPATIRDFVWWSGLTVRQAKAGIELAGADLRQAIVGTRTCWFRPIRPRTAPRGPSVLLLPNYDEYLIAYKDREHVVRTAAARDAFGHQLVVDGLLAGSWTRIVKGGSVLVEAAPYRRLAPRAVQALHDAAERLGAFMRMTARVSVR